MHNNLASQFSLVTQSCLTLCDPMNHSTQATLSITISWSLTKLMSIESVMPFNHFILCHLLLLLTSIFPSIRVFANESALCIRWSKYCSFSFSITQQFHNSIPACVCIRMYVYMCVCVYIWSELKWKSLSHVWLFVTSWTIQSMEFSRQEYWSG